jgi:glycosyltransferase involved in cell wall biosynthesis
MSKTHANVPMVGIFMPAYNQGAFIDETIESLKKQTFQDFVVHIVDDGSDDGITPKELASIKYDKAEVFLNSDNKGVVFRAMQHYKLLKTKYILVLCGDDKIAPTFLEKTVNFLEKNPKYGAVSTDMYYYMDSFEGKPFSTFHFDKEKMGLPAMLSECHCLGSALMRNKALQGIDLSGGFKRYQDWDRWISMLEAGWKIGLVAEPLFMYRLHDKSLSHSSSAKIETETFHKIITKHKELYQKYSVDVMEALFSKFQESGFFNKNLSRQYIELEKQNHELIQQINKPLSRRIIKKAKTVLKIIK